LPLRQNIKSKSKFHLDKLKLDYGYDLLSALQTSYDEEK
jgi:hypothetical protein